MTTEFCVLRGAKLAVEAARRQARVQFSEADGATLIRGYLQTVKEHGHLQFLAECAWDREVVVYLRDAPNEGRSGWKPRIVCTHR